MTVAPLRPHHVLALAAARLSRASPNAWVDFMAALEAYTAANVVACIQAQPDKIVHMQGRAQQCMELQTLLSDAVKTANEQAAKQK